MTTLQGDAAENFLERYPDKALAPYEEFVLSGKTYYFTPGGFLYRKDRGAEAAILVRLDIGDHLGGKTRRSSLRRENGLW